MNQTQEEIIYGNPSQNVLLNKYLKEMKELKNEQKKKEKLMNKLLGSKRDESLNNKDISELGESKNKSINDSQNEQNSTINNLEESNLTEIRSNLNHGSILFNSHLEKIQINNQKYSIQYNFERISEEEQLIVPIYLSYYIKKPNGFDVQKFNQYIVNEYSNENELVNLLIQLL